jgi:hypothetical protein
LGCNASRDARAVQGSCSPSLNYKAQTRGSCCVSSQGARAATTHKGQIAEWVTGSARVRAYAQLQHEHTFSFEPPGTLSRTCVDGRVLTELQRPPTRARAWAFLSLPQFRRPPGRTCGNTPRGKSLERIPGSASARKQALGLLPSGNRDKHVRGPRSPGRQLLWPHAYLN